MYRSRETYVEGQRRVLGYIRCSTLEQAQEGLSLQYQRAKIELYCRLHNMYLEGIIEDAGFSGKDTNRPGLQKLMEHIDQPRYQGVVVYKLDRLSRSTKDLLILVDDTFRKNKAEFFSVTEKIDTTTAQGRFFLTIIGALAQMERELTIERTIAGLEQTRANGTYLGAEPMGFKRRAGKLIRNSEERRLINRIVELRLEGLSLRAIGERLEEEGHKPKRGEHWHAQSLKLILDREGISKPRKKKKKTTKKRKKKRTPKSDLQAN